MISIEELAVQFDCDTELILQILRENRILVNKNDVNRKGKTENKYIRFKSKK